MPTLGAPAQIHAMTVRAVVHRACGCGHPNDGTWSRCPACHTPPARREDLGVVAAWHCNPLVRLWRAVIRGGSL